MPEGNPIFKSAFKGHSLPHHVSPQEKETTQASKSNQRPLLEVARDLEKKKQQRRKPAPWMGKQTLLVVGANDE